MAHRSQRVEIFDLGRVPGVEFHVLASPSILTYAHIFLKDGFVEIGKEAASTRSDEQCDLAAEGVSDNHPFLSSEHDWRRGLPPTRTV
jgi:hypothetical protein